ncbi:MAG: class I SAM-dependent methyltransferase [Bacteroidota bacterium]
MMIEFWDDRYSQVSYIYGESPNLFFKSFIDDEKPGKILLPAEGEGRNAVYAATKGWEVYAFDQSAIAREKALKLAKKNNTQINYTKSDAFKFDYQKRKYSAVGILHFHIPLSYRRPFFNQIIDCLIPSGKIVIEVFSTIIYPDVICGPQLLELRYEKEELEEYFNKLNIIFSDQLDIVLNEDDFHKGKVNVIRMIVMN